jgi:hypothetical protein
MRYTVFGLVLGIWVGLIYGLMPAGTFADSQISERIEITKTSDLFPVAVFPETEYPFEAVADGMEIRHDFIVQNTGTAELDIKKVKTG